MARWILIVGYDTPHLELAREDWNRYNVKLEAVNTAEEAMEQFPRRDYLAVITSFDIPDIAPLYKFMGDKKQIPLVVLTQNESGIRFMGSIIHTAKKVILDTERLVESIRENKEFFNQLTQMPRREIKPLGIFTHRDLILLVDYRMVFVRGQEVRLSAVEFEMLQLLLSHVGQVFTHEQLYTAAYNEYAPFRLAINSISCHIYRIRQRLRSANEQMNYIDSVKSIGYRMAV